LSHRIGLEGVDSMDTSQQIAGTMPDAAPRGLCTDCGISRTADPKRCGRACQFIKPDYPGLETRVHGRTRDPGRSDEMYFGPFRRMLRASMVAPLPGAQWTGIATRIAERLLQTKAVDAVLTMAADPADRWLPVPVLVTDPADMAQCRGMRVMRRCWRCWSRLGREASSVWR
jgi:coenzyme F420 hydrogenase subunit beta